MDFKLKAISNNVNNNDTIADLIPRTSNKLESKDISPSDHVCQRNVPVLYATVRGIHLRSFNKNATNNYNISFCDLERWVRSGHQATFKVYIA